jgi:hypothetical protein
MVLQLDKYDKYEDRVYFTFQSSSCKKRVRPATFLCLEKKSKSWWMLTQFPSGKHKEKCLNLAGLYHFNKRSHQ